jgi:GT2 family glycosyltransferase
MVRQVTDIYDNMVALSRLSRPSHLPGGTPFRPPRHASIIVLSWNHKELLQECLDAIKKAVAFEGGNHEIIVVDNGSTDGTADYVRLQYPEVRLVDLKKNYRFSMGNNYGVQCAKNDVVILLNNDVIVEEDFLRPLLEGFQSPDIFAVTSQIFNYYQSRVREETGKTFGSIVFGSVLVGHTAPGPFDSERKLVPVFYAGGGSTAYWRDKYLELRGFSELYNPAYVEDADISYRAWKSGYRVLFCPSSRVVHKHRSTTVLELGSKGIDYYISRNLFIFFWKNITSLKLFARHLCQFPIRILVDMSRGNFAILVAFVAALLKIPRILLERIRFSNPGALSDREVFETAGSWFFYRHRYLPPAAGNPERLKILVVSKRLPRRGMDGSWVLVNLLEGLSRHHDITLLSFVETTPDQVHAEALRKFCREVRTITLYPYHDELKSAYLFSKFLALCHAFLLMRKEVRKELQNGDYDLVQCEYLHTLNFVPDLSRVPSLLSHHEVLTLAYERSFRQAQGWLKKLVLLGKWRLTKTYEKRILRKISHVVLLSEKDQEYLARKMKQPVSTVIRSGVNLEDLTPTGTVKEDPHSLIFVGYFKHPPNVEAMLYLFRELWPALVRAVPDLKITVVGRYAPPEITAYSRTDRITFVDFIPDLRNALEQHAVFVAPIISGAGLRGKILEAMAMGKAIVATRRCMDGYPFRHNQDLMVAENSEEFTRYTVELLQDGEKRRRLGRNARTCVEAQFSSSRFVGDYERLYAQLSGNLAAPSAR